jgi:hypothetical protein
MLSTMASASSRLGVDVVCVMILCSIYNILVKVHIS